jgi:hypothetical protein
LSGVITFAIIMGAMIGIVAGIAWNEKLS